MSTLVALALVPPVALALVFLAALARRPKVLRENGAAAVIFAAHPDDCVILAGAYAIWARSQGKRVRVAYLTCGASAPNLARAQVRREESLAAWRLLDVPPDDVVCFQLPEHPVDGPSTWSEADRDGARAWIEGLLRELPEGGALLVPAAGEAHIDHRNLRRLVLEAWERSGRGDLTCLEGPEYNDYLSVLQSPEKVFAVILAALPVVSRVVKRRRPPWTGFTGGGGYSVVPGLDSLLEKRREMLRAFASENSDLLVRLFGWFERYRPVPSPAHGLAQDPPAGYLRWDGRNRGLSMFLAMTTMAEVAATLAGVLANHAVNTLGDGAAWLRGAVLALAAMTAVYGSVRRKSAETRIFYWALAVGAVIGARR
jgi:LmbE family N-acetylglucosaminyl deacetylase